MKQKIPKSFKIFSTTINVEWDNDRLNDLEFYGLAEYSACRIIMSDKEKGKDIPNDIIMDTYYHEKIHHILHAMNEMELCRNEQFVDVFARILRQTDETSEY